MSSINQTSVRAHTGETGANLPGEDHLIAHEALLVALWLNARMSQITISSCLASEKR